MKDTQVTSVIAPFDRNALAHCRQGGRLMAVRKIYVNCQDIDARHFSLFFPKRHGIVGRVVSPEGAIVVVLQHRIRQAIIHDCYHHHHASEQRRPVPVSK